MTQGQKALKEQLLNHLLGGEAFMPVTKFLDKIPYGQLSIRPFGLPYSFYELFYHIAYAQRDILDYCTAKDYQMPSWPKDYWPGTTGPKSPESWSALKTSFFDTRKELVNFINEEGTNLLQVVENGEKHNVLRELMLVIEHNAYHTGQLAVLMRLLQVL